MSIGCVAMVVRSAGKRGKGEQARPKVWQLVDATYGYLLAVNRERIGATRNGQSSVCAVHQADLRQRLSGSEPTQVPGSFYVIPPCH